MIEKHEYLIISLILLQESFSQKNHEECQDIVQEFIHNCDALLSDFNDFITARCQESELFKQRYHYD